MTLVANQCSKPSIGWNTKYDLQHSNANRIVIDGDDPGVSANDRLHGSLRAFGYDARTREAVVTFDAVRNRSDSTVSTRRFEARVPVAAPETAFVGPALNEAANDVAGQVADWLN